MNKGKYAILVCIMLSLSVISCFLCLINGRVQDGTIWLFILPACFFVNLLQLNGKWNIILSSITGVVVLILYLLRLVVTPMTMALGNYESVIPLHLYQNNIIWAVLLISFEAIVVFLILPGSIKNNLDRIQQKQTVDVLDTRSSVSLWIIVLAMFAFIIYMIKSDASIWKANFLLLIDSRKTYQAYSSAATGIGSLSMYVEIMNSFFKVIQVLLPVLLLEALSRSKLPKWIVYILSFGLFAVVTIIATEDRIDAVFAGLAMLLTMRTLYGGGFNKRFKVWLILILTVCVIGLCIKAGVIDNSGGKLSDSFGKIGLMFSAYFSGVPTVAYGISFAESIGWFNIWRIIPDVLAHTPFVGYALKLFFGVSVISSNQLFNEFISSGLGRNVGQILPTAVLGMEYFSVFFSPLSSCLMIKLAIWLEGRGKRETNVVKVHVFNWITICVAGSPIVASSLLVTAKLFWFAFIYVLVSLFDRKKVRIVF